MGALDPDIASLGRVRLDTWKVVVAFVVWLTSLSVATAANSKAITEKADRELVEVTRRMQIELLSDQLQNTRAEVTRLQAQVRELEQQVARSELDAARRH